MLGHRSRRRLARAAGAGAAFALLAGGCARERPSTFSVANCVERVGGEAHSFAGLQGARFVTASWPAHRASGLLHRLGLEAAAPRELGVVVLSPSPEVARQVERQARGFLRPGGGGSLVGVVGLSRRHRRELLRCL